MKVNTFNKAIAIMKPNNEFPKINPSIRALSLPYYFHSITYHQINFPFKNLFYQFCFCLFLAQL